MKLPDSVQEIAEVIGRERALYLVGQLPRCYMPDRRYPGTKAARVILYVPQKLKPTHPLVAILGWQDACRMVAAFGGEVLQPANCGDLVRQFRAREAVRMVSEGMAADEVAEVLGITARQVRNLTREITQEARGAANDNTVRTVNSRAVCR